MAAVVALRNAVDGADISLTEDLLRPLGPLGAPARGCCGPVGRSTGARNGISRPCGRPWSPPCSGAATRRRRSYATSMRRLPACPPAAGSANVTGGALELVCPAGTPASLRAAVDAGADAIYLGFRDETNARNFPGLNFSRDELAEGIGYAGSKGAKVLVAINTYPRAGNPGPWRKAVDDAAALGAWAVILADIGLLDYARRTIPDLRRHLSVQASAANARGHPFLLQRIRGEARRAAPRADGRRDRADQRCGRSGDGGLRLRRHVRDGGGALPAVLVRDRRVAQHERGLFPGGTCPLRGTRRATGFPARRFHHQQVPRGGAGGLSDPVQGALSGPASATPICSRSRLRWMSRTYCRH